jgi:hypothetical protein
LIRARTIAAVERRNVITGYRAVFGALGVAATATQLTDLAGKGVLNPVNFSATSRS